MREFLLGAALVLMSAPVWAQDLPDRRDALRLVFAHDADVESVFFPHPSLNAAQVQVLSSAMSEGLMPAMRFYGAMAMAPDEGLANPNTTVAVGNFHDIEAAEASALATCEAARDGGAPCVIIMQVRPAGWQDGQPLQLSAGAAEALRGEFRQAPRPRVMAISAATGNFGIGSDAASASEACNAADCRAVIADP